MPCEDQPTFILTPSPGSAQIRPAYETGRKNSTVDPVKFETDPFPRETRGFQPRSQTSRQSEGPAAPSTETSQSIQGTRQGAEPRYVPGIDTAVNDSAIKDVSKASHFWSGAIQAIKKSSAEDVPLVSLVRS